MLSCHKKCPVGWTPNKLGLPYCYKKCPSEFRDDPLHCGKPKAYNRGVGRSPDSTCPSGYYMWGLLKRCYKDNHPGWTRTALCTIKKIGSESVFNLGLGTLKADCGGNIPSTKSCKSNEDKYGLLCYPKCKTGYKPVGCCICSPKCPENYTDML